MKLEGILTQREWEKRVSFDLVYAWEDIFAQELGVPLVPRSRMAEALVRRLPGRQAVPTGKKHLLLTEMEPMPGKIAGAGAFLQFLPGHLRFQPRGI